MAGLTPPRPLTADDDRSAFDCGRESMNLWFQRHAWRNQQARLTRTNVVCDPMSGRIVGYVAMCTAQIERGHLPKADQRNRPEAIPAMLLAQLAIDRLEQGKGYARSLMVFALKTAVHASREVGLCCVVTHPLDDGVRAFYARFGFEDLPFDPKRSMAVRIADLELAGF